MGPLTSRSTSPGRYSNAAQRNVKKASVCKPEPAEPYEKPHKSPGKSPHHFSNSQHRDGKPGESRTKQCWAHFGPQLEE